MQLFSDSMISLCWLNKFSYKYEKMNKLPIFIMNRLAHISEQCLKFPITFTHVATEVNPSDCLTRALSYKQLQKSTYIEGPAFLRENNVISPFDIVIPNVLSVDESEEAEAGLAIEKSCSVDHLIPLDRISSLSKLINIHCYVFKFLNNIKKKLLLRSGNKYRHLMVYADSKIRDIAYSHIIKTDQNLHFSDVISFLTSENTRKKDIPDLVSRLNLVLEDGLLKVKSKFDRWKGASPYCFQILLHKNSVLTRMLIWDTHIRKMHSGVYRILTDLRKEYWVQHFFSVAKSILKGCVQCRRFNARSVKTTQNSYRDFRIEQTNVPFRSIFIDHLGPFYVNNHSKKVKVWLLCVSCIWSRAIHLIVCTDLSMKTFLRAFQKHVFTYGLPDKVLSDSGSQLVSSGNLINDFMKNPDISAYLNENGIKFQGFSQYPKGNSSLGSLVESSVKLVKRLLFGSIKSNVLEKTDFDLLICEIMQLANSRPIAFHDSLRDNEVLPKVITPENLIFGRDLITSNVIPALQQPTEDPDWIEKITRSDLLTKDFEKLAKVRSQIITLYNEDFFINLVKQATNTKDRYKPVNREEVRVGDVILLREPLLKPSQYPMALVLNVCKNNIGEVTDVHAKKGCNGEVVRRHVTSIVLYLSPSENSSAKIGTVPGDDPGNKTVHSAPPRPRRGPQRQCKRC